MTRWPIARYLLSSHTVFLVMVLAGFYVLVGVVVAVAAVFTPVTISGIDASGQALNWLALGYGYSTGAVLTTVLVHGRTRREFLVQHPVFQLVTAGILAAGITGVYALEAAVYRLAGWRQGMQDQRIYEPGEYSTIFLAHWSMLAISIMTGAFFAAAVYRWEAAGVLAFLPAAALVVVSGPVHGFFSLPFARFGWDGPAALAVVSVVAVATGWLLLWAAVRDVPLRIRVPA